MRELYDKLIAAAKAGDPGTLAAASLNWITQANKNPFKENTAESELFYKAKMAWSKWQANGIDARRNRVRVKEYVAQIAALDIPNPYIEEPVAEPQLVEIKTEPVHILGVLPEEETKEQEEVKGPEIQPVAEQKIEQKTAEETKKETVKVNKPAAHDQNKRQLLGKKKK